MLRRGGDEEHFAKLHLEAKKKSVVNRIVDKKYRMLSMAFNKLTEEWKSRQAHAKEKMRFFISGLRNKDHQRILFAYNGLKARMGQMIGVGYVDTLQSEFKKLQIALRLKDKNYDLMYQAMNAFKEYYKVYVLNDKQKALENEKKLKVAKWFVDQKFRQQAMAFRQLKYLCEELSKRDRFLVEKKRAVLTNFGRRANRQQLTAFKKLVEWNLTLKFRLRHKIDTLVRRIRDKGGDL